jgi:hypothetical protein
LARSIREDGGKAIGSGVGLEPQGRPGTAGRGGHAPSSAQSCRRFPMVPPRRAYTCCPALWRKRPALTCARTASALAR